MDHRLGGVERPAGQGARAGARRPRGRPGITRAGTRAAHEGTRQDARKRYIDKPSDATDEALVECRRLVEEAEGRVAETQKRLNAYPTEPDTDALLDVHTQFTGIVTDPTLTINAKPRCCWRWSGSSRIPTET
jgi:hypothetical protein